MRKVLIKLAAVVLSCILMCSIAAFSSYTGPEIHDHEHICCAAAWCNHSYTGTRYYAWQDCTGFASWVKSLGGCYERTRTVETFCVNCGAVLNTRTETQQRVVNNFVVTDWYYI